jgi:hypothetical protein
MWPRLVPALSAGALPPQVIVRRISGPRFPRLPYPEGFNSNDHLYVLGIGDVQGIGSPAAASQPSLKSRMKRRGQTSALPGVNPALTPAAHPAGPSDRAARARGGATGLGGPDRVRGAAPRPGAQGWRC